MRLRKKLIFEVVFSHQCEVHVTFDKYRALLICVINGTIVIYVSIYNALLMFVISVKSGIASSTCISFQVVFLWNIIHVSIVTCSALLIFVIHYIVDCYHQYVHDTV